MIVVEDTQWLDEASRSLLETLGRIVGDRVVMLLTRRNDGAPWPDSTSMTIGPIESKSRRRAVAPRAPSAARERRDAHTSEACRQRQSAVPHRARPIGRHHGQPTGGGAAGVRRASARGAHRSAADRRARAHPRRIGARLDDRSSLGARVLGRDELDDQATWERELGDLLVPTATPFASVTTWFESPPTRVCRYAGVAPCIGEHARDRRVGRVGTTRRPDLGAGLSRERIGRARSASSRGIADAADAAAIAKGRWRSPNRCSTMSCRPRRAWVQPPPISATHAVPRDRRRTGRAPGGLTRRAGRGGRDGRPGGAPADRGRSSSPLGEARSIQIGPPRDGGRTAGVSASRCRQDNSCSRGRPSATSWVSGRSVCGSPPNCCSLATGRSSRGSSPRRTCCRSGAAAASASPSAPRTRARRWTC